MGEEQKTCLLYNTHISFDTRPSLTSSMEQDAGLTYEQLNAWMDASRDGNIDRVRDLVENEGSDDKYTDNVCEPITSHTMLSALY